MLDMEEFTGGQSVTLTGGGKFGLFSRATPFLAFLMDRFGGENLGPA